MRWSWLAVLGLVVQLVLPGAALASGDDEGVGTPKIQGPNASWFVTLDNGSTNDQPSGGTRDGSNGLGVFDASLGKRTDAFDGGLIVFVNNQILKPAGLGPVVTDRNGQGLVSSPVETGGLEVTVEYFAPKAQNNVLRVLVSLRNRGTSAVGATVDLASNLGSDGDTFTEKTSDGDTDFEKSDRWIITSDDGIDHDPLVTHVLAGLGNLRSAPTHVSQVVFAQLLGDPNDTSDNRGIRATYDVTVPRGRTRHLLFFAQLNTSRSTAIGNAALFNANLSANPNRPNGLLAGLQRKLRDVLNWDFR